MFPAHTGHIGAAADLIEWMSRIEFAGFMAAKFRKRRRKSRPRSAMSK
jgi:hypothetical protein